jgi:uncharacterized repeat protein (TIGR01451 family)
VTCDVGTLGDGASATITLTVTTAAAGQLDNTASATSDVSDPDPSDDDDSASTTVSVVPATADLEVVKSAPSGPVYVGGQLNYSIVVTNLGPDTAHDVTLTDPLDADLSFVSTDHGGVESGGVVTWDLGNVASGDVVTIGLVVEVLEVHAGLANTATVASTTPDTDTTNDDDDAVVDTQDRSGLNADLMVNKTVDVAQPTSGDVVTYTVTVENHGPADATNVRLQDDLPAGLEYRSSSASLGDYDPATGVWRVGSLPNGASAAIYMRVKITAMDDGSIENVARVVGLDETDPDDTNDTDQRDITVVRGGGGNHDGNDDQHGGGGTAFTGANIALALALLLGSVAAGFIFLVAARRREDRDDEPDSAGTA